ncbi:SusD/RagB family nutrient-binding outer membrane lipoprotein [Aliifodinibius salipaludis]|uniref:SusD/RagB family nutrient-binding outer membrane lipoprotein n=1 Tax=Fodinibius salipaludis TaxID=2032627 RepID=A0A2A2G5H9_9BACT|nr:SusD/RagB family nutrient-binding outer membrane lipoprotein [Aliifodinibius salipaludis]PAU93026.1 SusD/RagB family nutrient-binding outer membrane lipoprotein [Aliifodinibius salipaludis]
MKKLILSITVIAFLVSSCEIASFDNDINKNPNLPSEAAPSQLIANAMLSLPGLSSSPQGEYNAQYLSEIIYIDNSLYPEGTTSFYWLYQGPLMNLQTAIKNTNVANEAAVAKILKAYYFWHMTDRWGDIPYSEALNGTEDFTPAYDTQEAIYDSLFTLLKEAGDQLEVGRGLSNDIMYGGDIEKWRKFGNTVRMLMALRLSERDEAWAEDEFTNAMDDGVMTSNDDNFVFQHLADENNENYWYNQIIRQSRVWWALPVRIIDMMEPNNDPRLAVYGEQAANTGDYTGLPFGTPNDVEADDYSLLGTQIYEQDAPVYLVTYAQAKFALAEAAQRDWTTDNPETHYNEAIEASIVQWTGSDAGVQSYLSEPNVVYNPANGIEMISEQRYLHLFMHGYEAWAEYRRTGYPDNMVNPQGRDVPLRQAYTSDEELNNTENYQEAVDRQFNGDNSIYGRLWWDVE